MGKLQIGEHSCSSWLWRPIIDTLLQSNHGESSFHPKTTEMEGGKWEWAMLEVGGVQMLREPSSCFNQTRRRRLLHKHPVVLFCSTSRLWNLMGRCHPSSSSSSLPPSLSVYEDQASESISVPFSQDTVAELGTNLSLIYVLLLLQTLKRLLVFCSIYRVFQCHSARLWIQSPYQSFECWQTNRSESAPWITGLHQKNERIPTIEPGKEALPQQTIKTRSSQSVTHPLCLWQTFEQLMEGGTQFLSS